MSALNPASYSSAQLIVTFVVMIVASRFLVRMCDHIFDKMFPAVGRDSVTRSEIKEIEKSVSVMRGVLLRVAYKMDVDIRDFEGLVE